ncbi:4605_t:CDS:1, partial [Paraglomus brasilianum]
PPNDARTYAQATSQQLNHKTNLLSQHSSSTPLLQPNSQSTPSMPPTTTTQSTSSNLVFVDETLTAMESVMSTSSENSDNANYFDSEMTLDSNNENTYENTNNLNVNETSDVQTSNDTKHNDDNSDTNMQTDTSHLSPKLSSSASLNYAPLSSQNSDPNDTNPYHTVTRSSIKKQRTN